MSVPWLPDVASTRLLMVLTNQWNRERNKSSQTFPSSSRQESLPSWHHQTWPCQLPWVRPPWFLFTENRNRRWYKASCSQLKLAAAKVGIHHATCDGFHKAFQRHHCDCCRLNRSLFYIVLGFGVVLSLRPLLETFKTTCGTKRSTAFIETA